MIIRNGQIIYVDNDSGHYQPTKDHLRAFCTHLEQEFGLKGNTVIGWHEGSLKNSTWNEFKNG